MPALTLNPIILSNNFPSTLQLSKLFAVAPRENPAETLQFLGMK